MERREFTQKLMALGVCPFVISKLGIPEQITSISDEDEKLKMLKAEKEFIGNWLSDLLNSMEQVVDRETQVKIIEGCGRGSLQQGNSSKGMFHHT